MGIRKTLGLEPLEALTATTSIRDGLATGSATTPSLIAKKQALKRSRHAAKPLPV